MKAKNTKYRVIEDPVYKYKRLDPIPSEDDIGRFYQSRYYDLVRKGGRAPSIGRIMSGGKSAKGERSWLRFTTYNDILTTLELEKNIHFKRLLDVGCGTGEFISFMKEHGWNVTGLEVSEQACMIAKRKGLQVYSLTVDQLKHSHPTLLKTFDAITLLHVLEHVPDPVGLLKSLRELLTTSGKIIIHVPNDFNELQLHAQRHLKKDPWWIAVPDHINYFTVNSLTNLLKELGFDVIYSQGDFPMELFLLMGEDYVKNPKKGKECHQRRVSFEMAVSSELRRKLYRSMIDIGMGRNSLVIGKMR
jgi:2-polyprenyl-3-methyl-5-hydroxy-6-metoxy-1,4-benzoquinol methylase